MMGLTHLAVGAALAAGTAASVGTKEAALVVIGSLLPDIDSGSSRLGRYNPLAAFLPHRGPTHSLLALILTYKINQYLGIGVASHILLDMATKEGVKLFWPFFGCMRIPIISRLIQSGGILDGAVCCLATMYCVAQFL